MVAPRHRHPDRELLLSDGTALLRGLMSLFVGGIGAAVVVVGFVGMLAPDFLRGGIEGLKATRRLYALSAARLTIGLALLLGAQSTPFPGFFRVLGTIVILRGLAIPALGPARVRALIGWLQGRPPVLLRAIFLPATALGGFLIWAAFQ